MTGISGESLREVMRLLPSPVTVVTAGYNGEIRGITIGSFTSTSLEPALVSFNVSNDSPMLDLLSRSSEFIVHFLKASQDDVSERFAVPDQTGDEQFDGVEYSVSAKGSPLLDGTLARLTCSVHAIYEAGDHAIIVGLVGAADEQEPGRPLIYHDRGYQSVG